MSLLTFGFMVFIRTMIHLIVQTKRKNCQRNLRQIKQKAKRIKQKKKKRSNFHVLISPMVRVPMPPLATIRYPHPVHPRSLYPVLLSTVSFNHYPPNYHEFLSAYVAQFPSDLEANIISGNVLTNQHRPPRSKWGSPRMRRNSTLCCSGRQTLNEAALSPEKRPD